MADLAEVGRRESPYLVEVDNDRVRVRLVPIGRTVARPTWHGTVVDEPGGVRFTGDVVDRPAAVVDVVLLVGWVWPALLAVLALSSGDIVGVPLVLVALVLGLLWWWSRRMTRRGMVEHAADVEQLLGRLLSDPRRRAPRR